MTRKVQVLIEQVQRLSYRDRIALYNGITPLISSQPALDKEGFSFWHGRSLEELIQSHQCRPLQNVSDLKVDFWPENESADEILEFVRRQRREDGARA